MKIDRNKTRLCDCSESDLLAELLRRIYIPKQLKQPKECLEVELPDWFKKDEWRQLEGDAGGANSKFFQVFFQQGPLHVRGPQIETKVKIFCPEFLRGPLTIDASDEGVWGSY